MLYLVSLRLYTSPQHSNMANCSERNIALTGLTLDVAETSKSISFVLVALVLSEIACNKKVHTTKYEIC